MSDDALDALRSLEKDTTPGPWRADTEHSPVSPKILSACMIRADNEWPGPAMTRQLRDAAFIVAAVEYVRTALAAAADAPQPAPTTRACHFNPPCPMLPSPSPAVLPEGGQQDVHPTEDEESDFPLSFGDFQ